MRICPKCNIEMPRSAAARCIACLDMTNDNDGPDPFAGELPLLDGDTLELKQRAMIIRAGRSPERHRQMVNRHHDGLGDKRYDRKAVGYGATHYSERRKPLTLKVCGLDT